MVIQLYRRLDYRETLKIKDPLEDDVMKVFCIFKICCPGGLQENFSEDKKMDFCLSIED